MLIRSASATRIGHRRLSFLRRLATRDLYKAAAVGLAVSDVLCLSLALTTSHLALQGFRVPESLWALGTAPILWIVVFHGFRLFEPQNLSAVEEFRRTIGASSLGILLLVTTNFWSETSYARPSVALTWALVLMLELSTRRMWRFQLARLKKSGRLALRTLIIGTNEDAAHVRDALENPLFGFRTLGYVGVADGDAEQDSGVLGPLSDLRRLIREQEAECLFVASSAVSQEEIRQITQAARHERVELRVAANLPQLLTTRVNVQALGPVMSLAIRPVHLTRPQVTLKRVFDVAIAGAALLVTLPVSIIAAAAVKLTSHGPVLFRQERVTRDGARFHIYKFRTMVHDADGEPVDTTQPFFKDHADARRTRVGSLLRKWSIDELPQLLNVVRGEMSLVGPRPLPVSQVANNLPMLVPRLSVPAGMTGWWQINGRNNVRAEEALRLDLFYIENWSLTLDVYILLKTIGAVLRRRGAI